MNGFRRTATTSKADTQPRETGTRDSTALVDGIISGLTSGRTPRLLARQYGLPLELVLMIIDRERSRGRFETFELRTENCSSEATFNPDPESLVCAGCPLLPQRTLQARSADAHRGVFSRVKSMVVRHTDRPGSTSHGVPRQIPSWPIGWGL